MRNDRSVHRGGTVHVDRFRWRARASRSASETCSPGDPRAATVTHTIGGSDPFRRPHTHIHGRPSIRLFRARACSVSTACKPVTREFVMAEHTACGVHKQFHARTRTFVVVDVSRGRSRVRTAAARPLTTISYHTHTHTRRGGSSALFRLRTRWLTDKQTATDRGGSRGRSADPRLMFRR